MKLTRLSGLLPLFTLFSFFSSFSQDFSNKGTDFWVGYGYHVRMNTGGNTQDFNLYVATGNVATNIKVEVPLMGWVKTYTVPANSVFEMPQADHDQLKNAPYDCALRAGGKFNTGIHLTSDNPVIAYVHIYNASVSGATVLFPQPTLGREYYTLNYKQESNEGASNSFFFVIATEPGTTTVDITTAAATTDPLLPSAGSTTTVTLTQGQIYNVMGTINGTTGVDLTGSHIKQRSDIDGACKKIAVFAGSGKIKIDCGTGSGTGDNIIDQCFPKAALGYKYLTAPTYNMANNYFRVGIPDPTTVLKINGIVTPYAGFYYDLPITSQPQLIEGSQPIMVAQYITSSDECGNSDPNSANGDPEMIYLSPIEQTIDQVLLNSTDHFQITESYINLIIRSAAIGSVLVDGASVSPLFVTHPGDPTYSYAQVPVATGTTHSVSASEGFNCIAYGYGFRESVGYNGGTNIKDLTNSAGAIDSLNIYSRNTKCAGDPLKFQVTMSIPPAQVTSIYWNFEGALTNVTQNSPVFDSTYFISGRQVWRYTCPVINYTLFTVGNVPTVYNFADTVYTLIPGDCGNNYVINGTLTIVPIPKADFSATPPSGCELLTVTFADQTIALGSVPNIWNWNYDDGNTATGANPPPHIFPARATPYNIKLHVITDVGCVKDTIKPLTVYPMPVITISGPPETCNYTPVTFSNTTSVSFGGLAVSWVWDFGDGTPIITSLNANSVVHTYTTPGTYTVTLTVKTDKTCTKIITKTIKVNEKPATDFILPGVCLSDAFAQFINTSTISLGALTYSWNFGDPGSGVLNTSTAISPLHHYSAVGYYNVTLTAHSPKCDSTITKVLTVNGAVPHADFSVLNSSQLCSNADVQIQNTSTVDFGGLTRVEIYWDNLGAPATFDVDNAPLPNKIYSHLYGSFQSPASKPFTIRYKVYSGGVCIDELTKNITVYASPIVQFNPMPDICLSGSPYHIIEASEVGVLPLGTGLFSGTGIIDPVNGIFDPMVAGPGTWTITYTFTATIGGCSDFKMQTIKVLQPPTAKFTYSTPDCETRAVTFIDQSTQGAGVITTWTWNFGDGTPILVRTTGASFTHIFTSWSPTAYVVKLTLTTNQGCYSSVSTKTVMIYPLPIANFSVSQSCLPQARAQFTNLSTIADGTQSQFTYLWNFGDPNSGLADTSTLMNPVHIFTALGPYSVRLTVTSIHGCVDDTLIAYNDIHPQPKADFTPTPPEVCEGSPMTFIDHSSGVDTTLRSWLWNFGDGSSATSTNQNPTYTYNNWGNYIVSLIVTNNYGCISELKPIQVIVDSFPYVDAGPTITLLQGDTHVMTPVVHASNLTYLWTPDLYMNNNRILNPVITAVDDITYTLAVTTPGGCTSTSNVLVRVLKPPLIPNTFTPNNDGTNDTWRIKYLKDYVDCRVQVFNRYGQLVFESQGYNTEWDGTYKGKSCPIGTYYYIIEMPNWRKPVTGYVTIIK